VRSACVAAACAVVLAVSGFSSAEEPTVPPAPSAVPSATQAESRRREAFPEVPEPSAAQIRWSRSPVRVGQQVMLEVMLQHSVTQEPRWRAPEFAGFLVERLPAQGSALERDLRGRAVRTTRFFRVLFPTRPGHLEVPESAIVLQDRRGVEVRVVVPSAALTAESPPLEGRPSDFRGAVGDVSVRIARLEDNVSLRGYIPLRVDVVATAHPAQLAEPDFAELLSEAGEVFPERTQTSMAVRQGELVSRRTYRFSLVPRRVGELTIPALSLAYFDPMLERYRFATTAPLTVEVVRDPAVEPPPAESLDARDPVGREAADDDASAAGGAGDVMPILAVGWTVLRSVALACALIGLFLVQRRRRRNSSMDQARTAKPTSRARAEPAEAVGSSATELSARERVRAVRADLREYLAVLHGLELSAVSTSELARRIRDDEAIEILQRLDRLAFASECSEAELSSWAERARRYLESADTTARHPLHECTPPVSGGH